MILSVDHFHVISFLNESINLFKDESMKRTRSRLDELLPS